VGHVPVVRPHFSVADRAEITGNGATLDDIFIRRSLTVLVVFTLLPPLTPAGGRQLSIKTESTVGLDEATRALIDHFRRIIHDQILDLIAQALP